MSLKGRDCLRVRFFDALPDEDHCHAYCPALHAKGAATWGQRSLNRTMTALEIDVAMLKDKAGL